MPIWQSSRCPLWPRSPHRPSFSSSCCPLWISTTAQSGPLQGDTVGSLSNFIWTVMWVLISTIKVIRSIVTELWFGSFFISCSLILTRLSSFRLIFWFVILATASWRILLTAISSVLGCVTRFEGYACALFRISLIISALLVFMSLIVRPISAFSSVFVSSYSLAQIISSISFIIAFQFVCAKLYETMKA